MLRFGQGIMLSVSFRHSSPERMHGQDSHETRWSGPPWVTRHLRDKASPQGVPVRTTSPGKNRCQVDRNEGQITPRGQAAPTRRTDDRCLGQITRDLENIIWLSECFVTCSSGVLRQRVIKRACWARPIVIRDRADPIDRQAICAATLPRAGDNPAREQVEDDAEEQPAFVCLDAGDVAHPDLIGADASNRCSNLFPATTASLPP